MIRSVSRFTLAAVTATAMLCGCQTDKAATGSSRVAMGAVNDDCPASGQPVDADAGTATWRGHTIGFCCPNCVASWNAMSARDKDAFVAQYTKP